MVTTQMWADWDAEGHKKGDLVLYTSSNQQPSLMRPCRRRGVAGLERTEARSARVAAPTCVLGWNGSDQGREWTVMYIF